MAKRVTITIKNDEVLTFLDRKVKEFNDKHTDESENVVDELTRKDLYRKFKRTENK